MIISEVKIRFPKCYDTTQLFSKIRINMCILVTLSNYKKKIDYSDKCYIGKKVTDWFEGEFSREEN